MEFLIIMIVAAIALAVVWALFIYMTEIRKDRKIMDDYFARKHKRKVRFKRKLASGQVPAHIK